MKTLNEIRSLMISTVTTMVTSDTSSKTLFSECITTLKSYSNIKEGIKALNETVDSIQSEKHYLTRLKKIVKYSAIACNTKLFVRVDKLSWYNIERALKLMEHLAEHYSSDVTKVKNKLNKLLPKDSELVTTEQKRKYNDEYASKLAELYKEYKLEDDEATMFVKVENLVAKMSDEAKQKLIAKIQASLGSKLIS